MSRGANLRSRAAWAVAAGLTVACAMMPGCARAEDGEEDLPVPTLSPLDGFGLLTWSGQLQQRDAVDKRR